MYRTSCDDSEVALSDDEGCEELLSDVISAFVERSLELWALLNLGMILPPSLPTLGGTDPQSPPELGDLGG